LRIIKKVFGITTYLVNQSNTNDLICRQKVKRKNFLVCKNVKFNSTFDKEGFFEWLNRVNPIVEIKKKDNSLYLFYQNLFTRRKFIVAFERR